MRIQFGVIDKRLCPRQYLLVNVGTRGFPTEVCVIGLLSNDGQAESYLVETRVGSRESDFEQKRPVDLRSVTHQNANPRLLPVCS